MYVASLADVFRCSPLKPTCQASINPQSFLTARSSPAHLEARGGRSSRIWRRKRNSAAGPTGRRQCHACRFHQLRTFDQAAKILLVRVAAGDSLYGCLQIGQGEVRRHQFEDDRAILELAAQPARSL